MTAARAQPNLDVGPPRSPRSRATLVAVTLLTAAVLAAGCGSGSSGTVTPNAPVTTPGANSGVGSPGPTSAAPTGPASTVAGGGRTSDKCYAGSTVAPPRATPPTSYPATEAYGEVWVKGRALASFASSSDPTAGCETPHVVGQTFAGAPLDLTRSGEPTVIVFMAHWCPHCNREVPKLVSWLNSHGAPKGVRIVGVATGSQKQAPNWPPKTWLQKLKWTPATLADDQQGTAATALGLAAYPYFVFLNADGSVFYRQEGEWDIDSFAAKVDDLRRAATKTPASSGAS